ncbi:hypothetical protein D3C71_2148420 [compost metagenome]
MSLYDRPSAAALRSSTSTRSSLASSRLVVRTAVSRLLLRASSRTLLVAASKALCPKPLTSLIMKLKPALDPRPRTAGGIIT